MTENSPTKVSYTIDEAVKATGVSRSALYEDRAAGKLEMRKRGATTLILAGELQRYAAALPVLA